MPSLSASGIGSGLDVEGLVQSLMSIERQPLNALATRQREFESQLSALGRVKSALSTFQSAMKNLGSLDKFAINTTSSSDDTIFTASSTSVAVAGSYTIDFSNDGVNQLAQAHKVNSTYVVADSSTSIGATGTVRIQVGATEYFDVVIDGTNNTLDGIKGAINDALDNKGVTATIINVDSGSRLVLTSDHTGTDYGLTITDQGVGNVASTLALADVTAAANAKFKVDGNLVSSQSNTATGVIEGVTLNLKALGTAGTTETLTIARDNSAVKTNVEAFVKAYNDLNTVISDVGSDELQGDSTLLNVKSQLRSIFNTAPTGLTTSLAYLSEVGITTERSGALTLNSSVLDEALSSDFDGVAELFANDDQGYAFRLEALADQLLDVDGTIDAREDGINLRIDLVKDRQEGLEYRLEIIEKRYREQFGALDSLLANLQSTSNYLAAQL
jgi:flagellar hook-associated protein 2